MEKIFVLEDVDMRQGGEGKSYGVTSALENLQTTNSLSLDDLLLNLQQAKINSSC